MGLFKKENQNKFIYVGRFSPDKHLIFNKLIDFELFIFGECPLEKNQKDISNFEESGKTSMCIFFV